MPVLTVLQHLWDRVTGTQPAPPDWVVAVSGVVALIAVINGWFWHLTRNAITIAHEGGHALVSLLAGRRLQGIRLHSDTSGETRSRGRPDGPGLVLTTLAGYLTPPLLGAGAACLLAVLDRHLPEIEPSGDSAGLHLLLRLPDGRDPEQVAALAAKHDVQLENATWHWAEHCTAPPTLLVGYGAQREHALADGIEALAAEPW